MALGLRQLVPDSAQRLQLGAVWEPSSNAYYRVIDPLKAMARRGHRIVWPDADGKPDLRRLASCDVVHVYRRGQDDTRRALKELAGLGVGITYDNDDDLSALPKEAPSYKKRGGLNAQRIFAETVKVARLASSFSTPSELLAEKYRRAGVERVEIIGNYLAPDTFRPKRRHEGVVVGWIAAAEHRADLAQIPIGDVLQRLMHKYRDVRVECVGVDLNLPERYTHERHVEFLDLPHHIGGFDIGIAPLADIPYNRTRSDIKLKEYAASGVPWLASPVGSYCGLGEAEGGRLVADDEWYEALEALVTHGRARRKLARRAKSWAKRQTIETVADRWEQLFVLARDVGRASAELG